MLKKPIVVATAGRSGSSLIASIFAAHRVWVGRCVGGDEFNPRGYFENIVFKPLIEAACPANAQALAQPSEDWPTVARYVLNVGGYSGGRWLVKHTVLAWPLWRRHSPVWILPRRSPEETLRSARRAGFSSRLDDEGLRGAIAFMNAQLDHLRNEHGGLDVDADRLVGGDFTQVRRALRGAGISPRRDLIETAVDPSLWGRA